MIAPLRRSFSHPSNILRDLGRALPAALSFNFARSHLIAPGDPNGEGAALSYRLASIPAITNGPDTSIAPVRSGIQSP